MSENDATGAITDNTILVGTGHILEKSVKEVEAVIDRENPDVVAVELCEARYKSLKGEVENFSVKDTLSTGSPFLILTHWLLAYVQKKMGDELGIEPGADMMAAIGKAEERGCKIALVDRPIQITMQRFWKKMKFFEKLKMVFSMLFAITNIRGGGKGGDGKEGAQKLQIGGMNVNEGLDLDRITDEDVVTQLMEELRDFSPGAATALLDERDAYIAGSLLELQHHRSTDNLEQRKTVAVVGAGHVAGIKNLLGHPELIPPKEELCALPKKRFGIKHLLGLGIGVALVVVFIAAFYSGISWDVLLSAFLYWVVINGVFSAIGVVIARGHPLSVLTAFSVAWLTSLNPFLAAGWFAGLVEAYVRKPTAEDLKGMMKVDSLRELANNKLFKVILVAALANLGSILGTFVGAYVVWRALGISMADVWTGMKIAIFGQ
ncbi:MAG: TraB/GumN family protein [Euryarchaeota archaeon]|nr:TraB/GumN family protein [Euryarchaeota archaeon]